jgi:hypothetical protein
MRSRNVVILASIVMVMVLLLAGWWMLMKISQKHMTDEHFFARTGDKAVDAPTGMSTRQCNVYYTKNKQLCDDGWYLKYDTKLMREKLAALKLKPESTLTAAEKEELEKLSIVNTDIDTFPFKQRCKLDIYGMKEATTHPVKINTDDDAGKRGAPNHWAFCFENSELKTRDDIKDHKTFKKVFEDANLAVKFPDATRKRYDMKTLYNDDLLNLHCHMFSELKIESGQNSALYNNRVMLELSLTDEGRIESIRPVYFKDATIFVHAKPAEVYNTFMKVVRTPKQFVFELKNYKPTIYKLLVGLCTAPPNPNLGEKNVIELVVPKQKPNISEFFTIPPHLLYDYSHYVDISDLMIET